MYGHICFIICIDNELTWQHKFLFLNEKLKFKFVKPNNKAQHQTNNEVY